MKCIGLIGALVFAPLLVGCDHHDGRIAGIGTSPGAPTGVPAPPLLLSLTISVSTLSPPFAGNVTTYGVVVTHATSAISFTPVASPGALVTINGVSVPSGQMSPPFPLVVGPNLFSVDVSAGISTRSYTVLVTREDTGP